MTLVINPLIYAFARADLRKTARMLYAKATRQFSVETVEPFKTTSSSIKQTMVTSDGHTETVQLLKTL